MAKISGGSGRGEANVPGREGGPYNIGKLRWSAENRHDGEYMPNGDIHVGPKFFTHDLAGRAEILVHEAGHGILDKTGDTGPGKFWKTEAIMRIKPGDWGYYSGNRAVEEAAADALTFYAFGFTQPKKISRWAASVYRRSGISPATLVRQMRDIVKYAKQGPEGVRDTIVDFTNG